MNQYSLIPKPNFGIIGHRGICAYAPENTLPSFALAKEMGVNWVEFDVQLTRCGQWVIMHDEAVDRTTNGHGLVSELSLEDIRALDAGSWFDARFKDTTIPTLNELLAKLHDWEVKPNIEVKGDFTRSEALADAFTEYMETHYPDMYAQPLVSSFSLPLLIRLRENLPLLPLGYLVEAPQADSLDIFNRYGFNTFHASADDTTDKQIQTIVDSGAPLLMYTVNDKNKATHLFEQGVTAVFSDSPDKLKSS